MKMKRYCINVIEDFVKRGLIKIYLDRGVYLFDMNSFEPSFRSRYKEPIKLYVGNYTTMISIGGRDVILFEKDGNIIAFNAKEFVRD